MVTCPCTASFISLARDYLQHSSDLWEHKSPSVPPHTTPILISETGTPPKNKSGKEGKVRYYDTR